MQQKSVIPYLILAFILFITVTSSFYQVREDKFAVTKLLGKIKGDVVEPGLHFKIPFVEQVYTFDKKILSLDQPPERFLTIEKKNLIVDYFVRYRISNLKDFYTNVAGDETIANIRLGAIINDILKSEFSKRKVQDAISSERDILTESVLQTASLKASTLGITVIDVRVKRVDFPEDVSDSVYERMIKERASVAKEFRSEGRERAIEIQARAERDREQVLAEAYRDAQIIKGEGDAIASKTYAKAYNKNKYFFNLYRSLEAYRKSFASGQDVLVLDGKSEFMRYFTESK